MNEQDKLELSAFFDDEAADTQRLGAVLKTAEGRDAWARQCLVRDALRGDSLAASQGGVADRVRAARVASILRAVGDHRRPERRSTCSVCQHRL